MRGYESPATVSQIEALRPLNADQQTASASVNDLQSTQLRLSHGISCRGSGEANLDGSVSRRSAHRMAAETQPEPPS